MLHDGIGHKICGYNNSPLAEIYKPKSDFGINGKNF
jgi:hypothetical protein